LFRKKNKGRIINAMKNELFHVFRNTPFGREIFLQSIYFCKQTGINLRTYIPVDRQFMMYFEDSIVTVDLDKAFFWYQETARKNSKSLMKAAGVKGDYFEPKRFTAGEVPEIPIDFDVMCCPRSISALSTKIRLGYIGPKVRSIIKSATFPVLLPTGVYKEWKNITVLFGGSKNSSNALRLGYRIHESTGFPLNIFTHSEKKRKNYYRELLNKQQIFSKIESGEIDWQFHKTGKFQDHFYDIPHDSLIVVGAYGHGLIKEVLFGSKMELIQSRMPNTMLIVGPHYEEPAT
jgi:hypothetical protein